MDESLTAEQLVSMRTHMNDDHADSLATYAIRYGGYREVEGVEMIGMDADAMELRVRSGGAEAIARIPFDHRLRDAADARATLIAMAMPVSG